MTDITNTVPESTQTSATPDQAALPDPAELTADPATPEGTPPSIATPESAPSRAQARIEELAAERQAARDAAEYWRGIALKPPVAAAPAPVEKQAPRFSDFESADDWAAAHAEFVEERAEAKANAAAGTRFELARADAEQMAIRNTFEERASKFKAATPSFDAVVGNPKLPITQAMTEVIQVSELGPEIAYHLGMNPDKAARIATLRTPALQAAALGRLEAELKAKPAPATPTRTSSRAPAPPTPVGNAQPSKDIESMTTDEYMAHRARGRKVIS